jgi:hypothetical protein
MVRAQATLLTELEADLFIPDEIPEEEWGQWVKENTDGADFYSTGDEYWNWNYPYEPKRID